MSTSREFLRKRWMPGLIGGGIALAGAAGFVAMTHAQDKAVPDKTAQDKLAQDKLAQAKPVQAKPAQQISTQDKPAVNAAGQTARAALPTAKPSRIAPFRGDTKFGPILLRKPMPPAKVQWQAALQQARQMQAKRQNNIQNAWAARLKGHDLDRTLLPVIMPKDGSKISAVKARMMSFGDAYALNLPQDKGVQITVYGNRSFVKADSGAISRKPVQRLLGVSEDVRISQTEDGWTATFTRFGVVYTVDVSCDDIANPACTSDAYIRQTVADFNDVTMGREAMSEAGAGAGASPDAQPSLIDRVSQTVSTMFGGK